MINKNRLFVDYYEEWIKVYKEGDVRKVTMNKYYLTLLWLKKLMLDIELSNLTRTRYQQLLNQAQLQINNGFSSSVKGLNIRCC